MSFSIRHIIIAKYRSDLGFWAFSKADVKNYWGNFLSASRFRVELIWRTGSHASARMAQGCLVASGYHSRHPYRCSKMTRCHRRIHVPKLEPSALVSCDIRWWVQGQPLQLRSSCPRNPPVSWMQQSNMFKRYDKGHGHAHYSKRGWLWTHQKIAYETSADVSSFGACLSTCGGGSDDQESVWDIGLGVLAVGYPAATKRPWTIWEKTGLPVRLIISTLILDAKRNSLVSW